jgi:ABC-2 type transport system permease protein
MNAPSNAVPEFPVDSQIIATAAMSATRPMYWSVRRELWENRSIYIAPLVVAAVMLFGFLISTIGLPERRRAGLLLDPAQQRAAIEKPYDIAAMMLILTAFIVGIFYCLDALHGERRDRSILFWKSLPVSDLTTVLSKASIPLVVLPLLVFAIIVTTQLIMLLLSTVVLLMSGLSAATLWPQLKFIPSPLVLIYALPVIALWHAPIYGWLLLVSGWARRATFLWALLPLFALSVFERVAFRTSHFASLLRYRLFGWFTEAFVPQTRGSVPIDPLTQLTPGNFLSTPGLWIGLAFAAAFLAAAVRLRRYREPI